MKRFVIILFLVSLVFTGVLAAQEGEAESQFEPLMAPGDFAITAGIGYGFFWGAIDVSGGVELMLTRVDLGGVLPITFGVAGKVNYYRYNYTGYSTDYYYAYMGGGAFATAHLGLKDIDLDENLSFLANVDTYIGLGMGFYSYNSTWDDYYNTDYKTFQVGLRTTAGMNYFLTPNFAITVEGGYYGGWGGGGLFGVLIKL